MNSKDGNGKETVMVPRADIVESEDKSRFSILVDLPNVDPSTLELLVERNVLGLTAKTAAPEAAGEVWFSDMPHGMYKRTFTLSNAIDSGKIAADLSDGVLTITLPKSEAIRPKKIEIQGL